MPCALALAQLSFVPGAVAQQAAAPLASGIDRSTGDPAVRIQDDAFRAVNGKWLADTPIPADRNSIGSFEKLYDRTQDELRGLVESGCAGHVRSGNAVEAPQDRRPLRRLHGRGAHRVARPRAAPRRRSRASTA